jgi:thiosulfate/3-mercaptopyruvate sulfurtransferase
MDSLVSVSWLANQLPRQSVVVLDATLPVVGSNINVRERYLAEHIPGAFFFDIEDISDQSSALPHMLPKPEAFSHNMSELGIKSSTTIVVYEQATMYSAPRAWWTLRAFGAANVYLLNGGLEAWRRAGFPLESGEVARRRGSFQAELDKTAIKDFAEMQMLVGGRAQILDARSAGRFDGTSPEPRPGISSGHVPGAINIPFDLLVDGHYLRPKSELRKVFEGNDVSLTEPIVTMCGSGVTAAVLNLGLTVVGAGNVSLYDGSWTEYAQKPGALIETSVREGPR